MDLLPSFRGAPRGHRTALSWVLSSDIRLRAGFASANRLMLMGFYAMKLSKQRVTFMVTTEQEALEGLVAAQPGVLILTPQLDQGSGLALVERARSVVSDIRTILLVNQSDDLLAAGRSCADAVLLNEDIGIEGFPLVTMFRTLALGQRYFSPSVIAALESASLAREPWRDGPPDLNRRDLEVVDLMVEGLGDRDIADQLMISYEAARSRSKALRRKLGVSSRAQVVAKVLQLGLGRLGGR